MKHPIARIFAPIAVIIGIAVSTVALAGDYGVKKEEMSDIVDGSVRINDAKVVKADIGASNGTIHAVDTVIRP